MSARGWLATLALVALAHPASAQDPERWREPRRGHPGRARQPPLEAPLGPKGEAGADAELDRFADEIARGLVREYGEAAREAGASPADCRDPAQVALHQKALRSFARYADCMRWAEVCEAQVRAGPALAPVLSAAARCASADDQLARAHDWHERATRPENAGAEVHPGMVYVFARFAFLTQYQQEVPQILARNPDWAGARLPVVQGALEYFLNGYTTLAPEAAIRGEALRWMATGDAVLEQAATVDWGWDLLWNRGQERDSARFFAEKADRLTSPQEVWPTALAALYYAAQSDFAPSVQVYDAVLPYLNADSPLPTQTNPYTYAELYARVCASGLSAGTTAGAYQALQRDWLAGRMDAAQARDAALRLQSSAGERADLLTLLGGLAEDLGRDLEARDWYWRAHQACPYYNRAHDGLGNIRLRRMSRAWADYEAILGRADQETREAAFSPDVRHFVGNWASLRDETRKQVLHGLRLWAPYLDRLRDGGALVYFKRAPERVSDIEGFEPFRDIRYPDGRLYDDIGGLAYGSLSVIHLAAAAESPFIGGDITAHEVAHVFHNQLSPPLQGCIAQLYARALGRGLFTDPYAATNEFEYFAVGAEVFLTPADAAPRFGVNQGWLERNDADLFGLLQQIATGREPSTLSCPVR